MKAIGNTPLIRLEHLCEPGSADIFVKFEGANPTGSMKDRMALSMIEGAEKRGLLKPGGVWWNIPEEAPAVRWLWFVHLKVIKHILSHPMLLLKRNYKQ